MCEYCRSNPCIIGCPNYNPPVYHIGSCDECGCEITSDDEEYLNFRGLCLCENCLAEFTLKGEDYQEADAIYEEEDYGDTI